MDLKARGLSVAPHLATGDGALGFWKGIHVGEKCRATLAETIRHSRLAQLIEGVVFKDGLWEDPKESPPDLAPYCTQHLTISPVQRPTIDWANRRWELDSVSDRQIYVEFQSLSVHINGIDILCDEIAQLELEAKRGLRHFGFL